MADLKLKTHILDYIHLLHPTHKRLVQSDVKNVILFELDYPRRSSQPEALKKQNRELQQTFRQFVRGYPTILLFNIERTYNENGVKDKDNITSGYVPRQVYKENPLTTQDFYRYLDERV